MLQGLVALLQNPKALLEHGQMILDGQKNSHKILESLLLAECAVQVEAEKNAPSDGENPEEPLFDDAALPPVIESCGLW